MWETIGFVAFLVVFTLTLGIATSQIPRPRRAPRPLAGFSSLATLPPRTIELLPLPIVERGFRTDYGDSILLWADGAKPRGDRFYVGQKAGYRTIGNVGGRTTYLFELVCSITGGAGRGSEIHRFTVALVDLEVARPFIRVQPGFRSTRTGADDLNEIPLDPGNFSTRFFVMSRSPEAAAATVTAAVRHAMLQEDSKLTYLFRDRFLMVVRKGISHQEAVAAAATGVVAALDGNSIHLQRPPLQEPTGFAAPTHLPPTHMPPVPLPTVRLPEGYPGPPDPAPPPGSHAQPPPPPPDWKYRSG